MPKSRIPTLEEMRAKSDRLKDKPLPVSVPPELKDKFKEYSPTMPKGKKDSTRMKAFVAKPK